MEPNEPEVVIPETPELSDDDSTDWQAKAQELQGQLKESRGIAKRYQTKLTKLNEKPVEPKAAEPAPKKGFDYAEKAYLKSSGIEAQDFELVKEVMDATGKDIDGVLSSKHFQNELKDRKELRMSEAATPSGSKRAGNTAKDQVDYWLAKGELPPAEQRELRQKVVNARIARDTSKSQFADQSVAGNPFK